MECDNKTSAGLLLSIGSGQFLVMMMLLEAVAPGYSMHDNAISDLGTIPETELLFGCTLFAIGLMTLIAGWLLYKAWANRGLLLVFVLGGIGAMGAALVPLDSPLGVHGLFAFVAFLFLNVLAIMVGLRLEGGMKAMSLMAGAIGLVFLMAMILVDAGWLDVSGSIGHGGAERMIAYPALIWMILFGGYLMARPSMDRAKPRA